VPAKVLHNIYNIIVTSCAFRRQVAARHDYAQLRLRWGLSQRESQKCQIDSIQVGTIACQMVLLKRRALCCCQDLLRSCVSSDMVSLLCPAVLES